MNSKRQRGQPLDGALNPNAETASQQGPVNGDDAERRERIAVAAYYKAERRGFGEGGEHDDWLEAEKEIDQPHDPVPGHMRAAASKKPERRKTARPR